MKPARMPQKLFPREYAAYFHPSADKSSSECGVVQDWLQSRFRRKKKARQSIECRVNPNDPPDVVWTDTRGRKHAFEVTEIVDGKFIQKAKQARSCEHKEYRRDEIEALVREYVTKKSKARFKAGPYYKKYLLIYTDEAFVAFGPAEQYLREMQRIGTTDFDEVWAVMPPPVRTLQSEGDISYCRMIRLSRKHANRVHRSQ